MLTVSSCVFIVSPWRKFDSLANRLGDPFIGVMCTWDDVCPASCWWRRRQPSSTTSSKCEHYYSTS